MYFLVLDITKEPFICVLLGPVLIPSIDAEERGMVPERMEEEGVPCAAQPKENCS